MTAPIAYVNGRYLPYPQAMTHVEDRGYQFGDAVYEVVAVVKGRCIDYAWHMDRLAYSLSEARIDWPIPCDAFPVIIQELLRRTRVTTGLIYIQISRGIAQRSFPFPPNTRPCLVLLARSFNHEAFLAEKSEGVRVITLPDLRWGRVDIKTVNLLPSVLAKQAASEAGAYDTVFVTPDDKITEATSSNVWIVVNDTTLQTHPSTASILSGITRKRIISLCQKAGLTVIEEPFSRDTLYKAREVFLSASNSLILPVVQVDDHLIGTGKKGPLTQKLQHLYLEFSHEQIP